MQITNEITVTILFFLKIPNITPKTDITKDKNNFIVKPNQTPPI